MVGGRTVLVTDAGRGSAISIIRSLGRRGYRVVAGDADGTSLGFRSRYATDRLVYPSPAHFPAEFVQCVLKAVGEYGVDLIIPVTDAAILPLSEERSRVMDACRVAMPEPDQLRLAINKEDTLALATKLGIPTPRGARMESAEAATRVAAKFGWPVVLKPKSSRVYRDRASIESFEVTYANTPEDLAAQFRKFEGRCDVLVQEYCAGIGYGIGLLMHKGRPLAAFQHRRLHELPPTGGASSLRESVPLDPILYDYSIRLLGAMSWTGLAMVEFKVGAAGPMLMEVNGRVWGSLPLAVVSGVDFPCLLAELYLMGPPSEVTEPQLQYRVHVRARNLVNDMVWIGATLSGHRKYPFLSTPGRGLSLIGILELLDPRCKSDLLVIDDPGPGLAEIPRVFGTLWQKFRRGLE